MSYCWILPSCRETKCENMFDRAWRCGQGVAWAVDVLCRWTRCCAVVDALCRWSRSCAGGRCAVSVAELLRVQSMCCAGGRCVACKKNAKICSKKREITHGFVWRQFAKEQSWRDTSRCIQNSDAALMSFSYYLVALASLVAAISRVRASLDAELAPLFKAETWAPSI